MAVDGEGIVRVAGDRDKAKSVAAVAVHHDCREWGNGTTSIAALSVNQGGVGSRNKSRRGGGGVVPGREA